ncbi:hypothetical protein M8C21_007495 [Ambrosia artemisiifolia]|uniref:Protein kinase domain-containing protein n=1 Tax=Ambrosia artemisiifolia TaxID=4212 RepID=A0AAD5CJT9_AMBAR|nr:hypothetical protein M8C21_007495 [Ambrosia artemisiifolia]
MLPSDIDRLSRLEYMDLGGNNFTGDIPPSLGNLSTLIYLQLYQNLFDGSIPSAIGNLSSLMILGLAYNKFATPQLPTEFGKLRNLTRLWMPQTNLIGKIPDSFANLSNLELLDLSSNNLEGGIPSGLFLLKNVRMFYLYKNSLSGEIPSVIESVKLVEIDVSMNRLTGLIPEEFGKLQQLEVLNLFSNQLSGNIPTSISGIRMLRIFRVFRNNLSGELPLEMGMHSKLEAFEVSENRLTGKLPEDLCGGGEFPKGIWSLSNLSSLRISGNFLSGELPNRLAWNLSRLEISDNKFSGRIPEGISTWKKLNVFKASNNLLSGEIPIGLTNLSQLSVLYLDGNSLSGELPSTIRSWSSLTTLNLARNKLSGPIPKAITDLPHLLDLDLSDNQFSGKIPPQLSSLRLTTLNLSSNNLTGRIPYAFDNLAGYLKKKQKLDLTTWKLTSFHTLKFTEANILCCLTDNNLIGSGGSGKVYQIEIGRHGEYVAVKRIWNNRKIDHTLEKEFLSEESKLLVYEYMENQSLDKWLHGKKMKTNRVLVHHMVLDWPKRLQIAIGAAQGLCYMHHDCSPPIIHRDVKSSNILLDSEFKARIADFGLAKILTKPKPGQANAMSAIAGSFGYIPPEYAYSTTITERVDVYSFGVVLLELVTGKEPHAGDSEMNLAEWTWKHFSEGKSMVDALDPEIKQANCYMEEISLVFKLGLICTSTLPSSRPSMKEVLEILRRCDTPSSEERKVGEEIDVTPLLRRESYLSNYRRNGNKVANQSIDILDGRL